MPQLSSSDCETLQRVLEEHPDGNEQGAVLTRLHRARHKPKEVVEQGAEASVGQQGHGL